MVVFKRFEQEVRQPLLEKEAARIVSLLPGIVPGRNGDEFVRVPFSIPITFRL
jgi:hypothetical protein